MGGFNLTIQEGKDAGREFTFDQPEVSVGRTSDNDVVLFDPGVSRKHAVLRYEAGKVVLQDMGSANGTQVNGTPVVEQELSDGDQIQMGPVVFSIAITEEVPENATRIVDTSALPAKKPAARGAADNGQKNKKTTALAPVKPSALATRNSGPSAAAKPSSPARAPARPGGLKPPSQMSAAERARVQRNATAITKFKLWLAEQPDKVRHAILGGAGALALLLVGGLVFALTGHKKVDGPVGGDMSKETFPVGEAKNDDVYGFGDDLGVTVQTRDEAHFQFAYDDAIPKVIYLRFQSSGIDRADEVEVTLNGVRIGNVNAGLGDYTKEQRIKLPRKHLKSKQPNEIVFDNTMNPPGNETWSIRKVRLLVKPQPQGPANELLAEAKRRYDLAEKALGMRDVAARNRFDAWMNLQDSMLYLEGIDPKPDLYDVVAQTLKETAKELDGKCQQAFLGAKRNEELKNMTGAVNELKNGLLYFPTDEHPCHSRLKEAIADYGE